jgi:hypothetical protein
MCTGFTWLKTGTTLPNKQQEVMLVSVLFDLKINLGYMFYFQAEGEKLLLTQNLRESQAIVERSQGELQAFMARLVQLAAHVDSLHHLCQKANQEFEEHNEV